MAMPLKGPNANRRKALMLSVHGDPVAPPGDVQTGGQNVYVREVATHLAARGWEVHIYTRWARPEALPEEVIAPGVRVIRIPAGRKGFISKDILFHKLPEFLKCLREKACEDSSIGGLDSYDIIHTNYWLSGWTGRNICQSVNVPHIHTSHSLGKVKKSKGHKVGPIMGLRISEEAKVFDKARKIVATSPVEMGVLTREYQVDPLKIKVVPCGYDPSTFHSRGRARVKMELDLADRRVIMFAGRFDENKGLKVLLKAFSQVAKSRRRPALLLVAGGDPVDAAEPSPEKLSMLELAQDLKILPQVRFVGPLDQECLSRYYRAADVCVVPSLYESFGMVALEALASGCPVVASQAGGLTYLVRHGENGYLVPPGDASALAKRIEQVIDRPYRREALSINATRVAKRGFTWEVVAKRMENLYSEVMEDAFTNRPSLDTGD